MSANKIVRYLGIDFGTSTTVVYYRDYREVAPDQFVPILDVPPRPILFGVNHETVPTLVFDDGKGTREYGYVAEELGRKNPQHLKVNFKMNLTSEDKAAREEAQSLLKGFLAYLYKIYRAQCEEPLGVEIEERTCISYPVKWPIQARVITETAADEAGFPHVSGCDEPLAAMQHFLTLQSEHKRRLEVEGVIQEGKEINVLLIDMGAGTTDLVLYSYLPGQSAGHRELYTWPTIAEKHTFGGGEIDALLAEEVRSFLVKRGVTHFTAERLRRECKAWKEHTVSPLLGVDQPIVSPPPLVEDVLGEKAGEFPRIDRERLGELLRPYLYRLPELVNEIIEHATEAGKIRGHEEIDIVVLTGGHSDWYFVREILLGNWVPGLPGEAEDGSGVILGRIRREPYRIIQTPKPQQTVAKGLAMLGEDIHVGRILSNSYWVQIRIGASLTEPIEVAQISEELPISDRRLAPYRFRFKYKLVEPIPMSYTALAGKDKDRITAFGPETINVSLRAWVRLIHGLQYGMDTVWKTVRDTIRQRRLLAHAFREPEWECETQFQFTVSVAEDQLPQIRCDLTDTKFSKTFHFELDFLSKDQAQGRIRLQKFAEPDGKHFSPLERVRRLANRKG